MTRWLHASLTLFVGLGIVGALTLRGQTPGSWNARNGLALHGYDAVAYFDEGRAVEGRSECTFVWEGIMWRFSAPERRDRFAANPATFAPQFGGFCAYGVSRGYAVDVDPEAFAIVDGRLYLNYSKRVQRLWNEDRPGFIKRAEANWPKVMTGLMGR
jgi:hypothetical protein